jgi:hypothetical protein
MTGGRLGAVKDQRAKKVGCGYSIVEHHHGVMQWEADLRATLSCFWASAVKLSGSSACDRAYVSVLFSPSVA